MTKRSLFLCMLSLVVCAGLASATIIGTVSIAPYTGGGTAGVTVDRTGTFFTPTGAPYTNGLGGTQNIVVTCLSTPCNDSETNLTYNSGSRLLNNQAGAMMDITLFNPSAAVPNPKWLTIAGTPIDLALNNIGPGVAMDCATVTFGAANGTTCSPVINTFTGPGPTTVPTFTSPYLLTIGYVTNNNPSTNPSHLTCNTLAPDPVACQVVTGVQLNVAGTATDASPNVSSWFGSLTTQIAGQTPSQIEATINSGNAIQSSYSGEFTATFTSVPEPATGALIGGALIGLAALLRRRRKA